MARNLVHVALFVLVWLAVPRVSAQNMPPVDVFSDETYSFSGSPGGYGIGPANVSLGTGDPLHQVQLRLFVSGSAVETMEMDFFKDGSLQRAILPLVARPFSFTGVFRMRYSPGGTWYESTSLQAQYLGSGSQFNGTSQLSFKLKNETGAPTSFTWSMEIPEVNGSWVNGSQASSPGRTMGSTVSDLANGQTATLNGPSDLVTYLWSLKPAEGTGANSVEIPGEITLMMGGTNTRTLHFDVTRVFNMTVSTGAEAYDATSSIPPGQYDVVITLTAAPVMTMLTVAYNVRNSTSEAQPLRLMVDGEAGQGGGGMFSLGSISPTNPNSSTVPLSQEFNVLESDLANKAWRIMLGSKELATGTFPATGPFTATASGEAGNIADGYEFMDGHWVPRGGGENETLKPADDPDGDPVPAVAAPEGQRPGDNAVVAAKATASGMEAALTKKLGSGADLGVVPGQVSVKNSDISLVEVHVVEGGLFAGIGQASGFTFSFLGRTYDFDMAAVPAIAEMVPKLRALQEWMLYFMAAWGVFKILSTLT